jgi:RNA polymerase sigma-70 factor (ECF subfamily)
MLKIPEEYKSSLKKTDKINLKKINQRDSAELEKLYHMYKRKIYNYLLIKTNGNIDTANEILCETFCSVLESAPKLKNTKNINSWLMQIACRRLNDYLRKNYRNKKYYKYFYPETYDENNIIEELETKKQILLVNNAIENIKPDYKKILKLKYIEKKSLKEISKLQKKSISSITSTITRARKEIKKQLTAHRVPQINV